MSAVEDILSQIPLNQLAGQLGVNEQEAEQAARTALPALLGGIQANTEDPGGASSITLTFYYLIQTQENSPGIYDTMQVYTYDPATAKYTSVSCRWWLPCASGWGKRSPSSSSKVGARPAAISVWTFELRTSARTGSAPR